MESMGVYHSNSQLCEVCRHSCDDALWFGGTRYCCVCFLVERTECTKDLCPLCTVGLDQTRRLDIKDISDLDAFIESAEQQLNHIETTMSGTKSTLYNNK
jgi:hypothetical protein